MNRFSLSPLLAAVLAGFKPPRHPTPKRSAIAARTAPSCPSTRWSRRSGLQVELPGLRPQGLALSPDGKLLVTSGKTSELIVVNPVTGEVRQRVALPNDKLNEPQPAVPSANILKPDKEGQLSYTGLVFSPDGRQLFLSNVNGSIKVFTVAADGTVSASHSIPLPAAMAPRRKGGNPGWTRAQHRRRPPLRLRQPLEHAARTRGQQRQGTAHVRHRRRAL